MELCGIGLTPEQRRAGAALPSWQERQYESTPAYSWSPASVWHRTLDSLAASSQRMPPLSGHARGPGVWAGTGPTRRATPTTDVASAAVPRDTDVLCPGFPQENGKARRFGWVERRWRR